MKTIAFLLAVIFSTQIYAEATKKIQTLPMRKRMNAISGIVRDLGIYIASEQEFVLDKNKNIIQNNLEKLSKLFKNLRLHPVIDSEGLLLNQTIMTEQLEQTVSLFKNGRKSYARAKFNAALNLCVSCHRQSPGNLNKEKVKIFADKDIKKFKISDYERAELYFVTRDFEEAMKLYDKFIRASKKTDDDEFIYKALLRQLVYFIGFKKNFSEAKNYFEGHLKDKILSDKISLVVTDWVKILSGKSLWEQYNPETVKEEDMEKFMKTFIADDEEGPIFSVTNSSEVNDLNLSSILMDYYNAHPQTKLGAKILFWLATVDKRTNDDLFFSLGDYYLLACMEKYPKDPIAKDCYEAYLDDLGINDMNKNREFNPEVKKRVKRLQKLIDYHEEDE